MQWSTADGWGSPGSEESEVEVEGVMPLTVQVRGQAGAGRVLDGVVYGGMEWGGGEGARRAKPNIYACVDWPGTPSPSAQVL